MKMLLKIFAVSALGAQVSAVKLSMRALGALLTVTPREETAAEKEVAAFYDIVKLIAEHGVDQRPADAVDNFLDVPLSTKVYFSK